jgi:predicted Zn-dependent protease
LHKPLDFGLTFPSDWQISNQTDRIVAVDPGQAALLEIRLQPAKQGESPDRVLTDLGVRNLVQGDNLTIKGFQAYTARGPVGTDIGQRTARFVVLTDRSNAVVFTGIAKNNDDLSRFESEIMDTARSYHRLSGSEQNEASAHKLALIRAERGTRLETLANQSPLREYAQEQLRLLNDLYPSGEPQPGQRLKIVR